MNPANLGGAPENPYAFVTGRLDAPTSFSRYLVDRHSPCDSPGARFKRIWGGGVGGDRRFLQWVGEGGGGGGGGRGDAEGGGGGKGGGGGGGGGGGLLISRLPDPSSPVFATAVEAGLVSANLPFLHISF